MLTVFDARHRNKGTLERFVGGSVRLGHRSENYSASEIPTILLAGNRPS